MDDRIIKVAIIGCGGRGGKAYGRIIHDSFKEQFQIVALCDINPKVLYSQAERFQIGDTDLFLDENAFFEKKRADLLIVATQDRDHVRMTIKGMELGYDVLVEKPLTSSKEECQQLLDAQKQYGRKVIVCHVLRYAPAFTKVEELLNSGEIGRLVSISALEQIHYLHYAHSYVRGNWNSGEKTSPIILAKCCHDLDLIQHYAGARCDSVSSVGGLTWFKEENAPQGHAHRCVDCQFIDTCPYSAKRIYLDNWKENNSFHFTSLMTYPYPANEEEIMKGLRDGKYGRCVYSCDNDVADHQMTVMTFENGVTATLTLMAFTGNGGRVIRLFGTLGEIDLDEEADTVKIKVYGEQTHSWKISDLIKHKSGHGGGDYMLVHDMYDILTGKKRSPTTLSESIESHMIGISAEKSRLNNGALVKVHD